jgi:4-aminobutyrate aminotransferase
VDGDGRPDAARAGALLGHLRHESKVLVMTCGPHGSTVRWIPPLVVSEAEIDRAVQAFDTALAATA